MVRVRFSGLAWIPALAMVVLSLLASGCGGGTRESDASGAEAPPKLLPGQISLHETVWECLTEVGVQIAVAPRDLAFFRKAQAANDVEQIGWKWDRKEKAMVRLLGSRRGGAKEWMLWYSQPWSASESPDYILRHPNRMTSTAKALQNRYVTFKVKPKLAFRKEIHRCVEFSLDG